VAASCAIPTATRSSWPMTRLPDLSQEVDELTPGVIALRRELHQHPELAFEEVRTSSILAGRMRALDLAVQEGIGGTGVMAVLEGAKPGKVLLIRSDMDALPMEDTTGRDYASRLPNRNHACGHDAHSAIVAGVAELLVRHRESLTGRVAFVFQPADEPMCGAKRMIEDGLLAQIEPDMSMAVHVLPMANAGQAVIQEGPIWASRDELILRVRGPQPVSGAPSTFDPARNAALITTALYEVGEQEGKSDEGVTFRVRSLRAEESGPVWLGGSRSESGQAAIEVNLAVYDNALRARLLRRIEEIGRAIVNAAGATLSIEVGYALPALVNDGHVTGALLRAARRVIGEANIITNWRNPFSDDFALFMAAAPGCLLLLGTANPDKGITGTWHTPAFDIDEDALPVGVQIMSLAALDLLR
jgi:amidohydrolase